MKKIILFILLIVLFIANISCNIYNEQIIKSNQTSNNHEEINFIQNGQNLFVIMPYVCIDFVKDIIGKYTNVINSFINYNNFSNEKIEDNDLVFLILYKKFSEILTIDEDTIDKIHKMRKSNKFMNTRYEYDIISKLNSLALYYVDGDVIIIRYYPIVGSGNELIDKISFISTILAEYNHVLIQNNLENRFGINWIYDFDKLDSRLIYCLDEAITLFFGIFMEENYEYLKNNNFIISEALLERYVNLKNYRMDLKNNRLYRSFKQKISSNFLSLSELFLYYLSDKEYQNLRYIYYLYFVYMVTKYYGYESLLNLIRYLYNSNYNSFEKIIKDVFNDSVDNFIEHWESEVKEILN